MSRSAGGGQKLAMKLGMVGGIATFAFVLGAVALGKPVDSQAWLGGAALALVGGAVGFFVVQSQAAQVASRVTDLRLAVSKLGRGQAEVRVRVQGNDEVGQLGRSIQHLAGDQGDRGLGQDTVFEHREGLPVLRGPVEKAGIGDQREGPLGQAEKGGVQVIGRHD